MAASLCCWGLCICLPWRLLSSETQWLPILPHCSNDITTKFSLRTPACERQNSSYRSTFTIPSGQWTPVRLPWSEFEGYGPGPNSASFVPMLRRLGVVSIGETKEDVILAVGKVGFYNVIWFKRKQVCYIDMDFMEYQPKLGTWHIVQYLICTNVICTNVETMILDFAGADDWPMDCSAVGFAQVK